jgi:hypothetical protein
MKRLREGVRFLDGSASAAGAVRAPRGGGRASAHELRPAPAVR